MAHVDLHDEARPVHKPGEGFDRQEPNYRWIWSFSIASVVLMGVLLIGVHLLYEGYKQTDFQRQVAEPVQDDLVVLRDREERTLNHDSYVDRNTGAVRLSINRAMDLLAKEYAEGRVSFPTAPAPVKPVEPEGGPAASPNMGTPNANNPAANPAATPQGAQPAKPAAH